MSHVLASNEAFRRKLAERVVAAMPPWLSNVSPYIGEDLVASRGGRALRLLENGGRTAFRFLAFGFVPLAMWDIHVGVVDSERGVITPGLHVSRDVANADVLEGLRTIALDLGTTITFSTVALEYQANLTSFAIDSVEEDEAVALVSGLCVRMSAIVRLMNRNAHASNEI